MLKNSCYKFFRYSLILLLTPYLLIPNLNEINFPQEFESFTSSNFQGFTKPFFTTLGQGAQSNLYTRAVYEEKFGIFFDLSVSSMIIPQSQKTYTAQLPKHLEMTENFDYAYIDNGKVIRNFGTTISQPTIYGESANTVYLTPKTGDPADSIFKTIGFLEGNRVNTMMSLPALQFGFSLPTRTQIRLRYLGAPTDDVMINFLSFNVNQQIDHFMGLFDDDMMGLAFNVSYQNFFWGDYTNLHSYSAGLHFSKAWENGLAIYTGLQYENLSGQFSMNRSNGYNAEFYREDGVTLKDFENVPNSLKSSYVVHVAERENVKNSPYEEVRLLKPVEFDIESFTNIRFLLGASYKVGIAEFHVDMGYASQMFLNGGVSLTITTWGGN